MESGDESRYLTHPPETPHFLSGENLYGARAQNNPSNAEATFIQSTKMQKSLKTF